jgi:hypothetical protein
METQDTKTKNGGKAGLSVQILQSLEGVLFWGFLLFVTSGDLTWTWAWMYLGSFLFVTVPSALASYPELREERGTGKEGR